MCVRAQAKGLHGGIVITRHALRNALIPVLTLSGPILATLITGSFFVESIYQVPGLGRFFVRTVLDLDYPVLIATTLLYRGRDLVDEFDRRSALRSG